MVGGFFSLLLKYVIWNKKKKKFPIFFLFFPSTTYKLPPSPLAALGVQSSAAPLPVASGMRFPSHIPASHPGSRGHVGMEGPLGISGGSAWAEPPRFAYFTVSVLFQ